MADKKLLVVFGATGKQGGSVINSVLGDEKAASQFSIRGITRDPSKPSAQALAKKGVECVKVGPLRAAPIAFYLYPAPGSLLMLYLGGPQQ